MKDLIFFKLLYGLNDIHVIVALNYPSLTVVITALTILLSAIKEYTYYIA